MTETKQISTLTIAYYIVAFNVACEILRQQSNYAITRQQCADWLSQLTRKELDACTQEDVDRLIAGLMEHENA